MSDEAQRLWVDDMPEAYERWLAPSVFQPFAVDLARRASAHRPDRVLELAAGTGVLTRELVAALPAAEVTATDLNAAMVDFGRRRVPQAVWRQADAMDLPFGDGRFDLVACQFGVMFFPDKPAAFAEARRVLRRDGTLLVNTWDTLVTHQLGAAVVAGLRQLFPTDPPTFLESIPHGYADVDVVVADLAAGGLRCVGIERVTLPGRAESAHDVAAGFCAGTPLRAGIEARGHLSTTIAAVTREVEARLGSGPVTGSMTAYVIEATPDL